MPLLPQPESSRTKATRQQQWRFLSNYEDDDQHQSSLLLSRGVVQQQHYSQASSSGALTVRDASQALSIVRRDPQQRRLLLAPIAENNNDNERGALISVGTGRREAAHHQVVLLRQAKNESPQQQQQHALSKDSSGAQRAVNNSGDNERKVAASLASARQVSQTMFLGSEGAGDGMQQQQRSVTSGFLAGYQKQLKMEADRLARSERRLQQRREQNSSDREGSNNKLGLTGTARSRIESTASLFCHNPPLTTGPLRSISFDKMETARKGAGGLSQQQHTALFSGGKTAAVATKNNSSNSSDPLAAVTERQRRTIEEALDMKMIPRSAIPFLLPRLTYRPPASSIVSQELMRLATDRPWEPAAQQSVLDSCMRTAESIVLGPGMQELRAQLERQAHQHQQHQQQQQSKSAVVSREVAVTSSADAPSSTTSASSSSLDSSANHANSNSVLASNTTTDHAPAPHVVSLPIKGGIINSGSNSGVVFANSSNSSSTTAAPRPPPEDVVQSLDDMVKLRQLYLTRHPPSEELRMASGENCPEEVRRSLAVVRGGAAVVPVETEHRGGAGGGGIDGVPSIAAMGVASSSAAPVLMANGPLSAMEDASKLPSSKAIGSSSLGVVSSSADASSLLNVAVMTNNSRHHQNRNNDVSDSNNDSNGNARLEWLRKQQREAEVRFGLAGAN